MSYGFNFLACLAAVILQTAVLPRIPLLDHAYDLIVPFIVFLGLYRPIPESLVTLTAAGLVMDGLSGGALGLYVSAYLWIYLALIWLVRYLHLVNSILLPFVVACGVLLQNVVFIVAFALGSRPMEINATVLWTVSIQFLLAVGTGPFVLLFYRQAHLRWQTWTARWLVRRNGARGQ